jgi:hypothetical protein
VTATVFRSGLPITIKATVTSNEPQDGLVDGDVPGDWTQPVIDQESGIIKLSLRSERSRRGNGREYTIVVTATDSSGNASMAAIKILVPHDKQ